jgi:quercetin dioxygenase-like cupin family protein
VAMFSPLAASFSSSEHPNPRRATAATFELQNTLAQASLSTALRAPKSTSFYRSTLAAPPHFWGVTTRECVMALTSARLQRMSLETPEEVRPFEEGKGKLELVNLAGGPVGRATFEPGWQWSKHIKPIAKTDSCQAAHVGYFISGRMKVVMDDGAEDEFGPGDLMICPPGHDAWIVGDEACVVIDWQGFADYAKR